ncbi:membrane protein insertase YidC [Desulfatiferula olefinivorans]
MEQKNLFTAIILSVLVFMVWNYFFMPAPQELPPAEPQSQEEVIPTPDDSITRVESLKDINTPAADQSIRLTTVRTPLYEIVLSNRGAVMNQIKLKAYKQENTPDSDLKSLIDPALTSGNYGLSFKNNSLPGLDTALFAVSVDESDIDVVSSSRSLVYTFVSESGVVIEKTFVFSPDTYLIDCHITVKNASDRNFGDDLMVHLSNRIADKTAIAFEGPAFFLNNELNEIKIKKIDESGRFSGNVNWLAIKDRYFMLSLLPGEPAGTDILLTHDETSEIITAHLVKPTGVIAPGTQKQFRYAIYNGPKQLSILKTVGSKLDKAVNFGWFDFLAKPCLTLMDYIYLHVVGNYGIAIIILTILFKIILWPLGSKSYKSMNDMKKLQPLVAEIREKHKANKQKMNEEMMNLYRTYKVNPLSGCLPMVVQMPIFFAFYKMLYQAIELRHAPFFAWITDLSAPDRLFHFNVTIPFFEPPTGIPVLTLLMGASMVLQQKMAPPAGDPAQAKMMMLMPVFMTFIFMNFSSGLVLYWLVNNIVSILQQYYIMKKNA